MSTSEVDSLGSTSFALLHGLYCVVIHLPKTTPSHEETHSTPTS